MLLAALVFPNITSVAFAVQPDIRVNSPAALRKAAASASPGSTIVLADGVYDNPGSLKLTASGAPQSPIIIRAATPGGVIFTGEAQFRIEASHVVFSGFRFTKGKPASGSGVIVINGNNNRITDCAIIDFNSPENAVSKTSEPAPQGSTFWVALRGQRNRVDHCLFKGKNTIGVLLFVQRPTDAPDYAIIDHNVFRDIPHGSQGNGYETVRIGTSHKSQSDSHSVVFENYFENCDGEIEVISIKSGKNTVRQNTFVNCNGTLTLRHGVDCIATGNLFLATDPAKTGCAGIRINDRGHIVENNYIAGLRRPDKHRGGLVLMSSEAEGPQEVFKHWRVTDVVLRRNSVIDCEQSIVYGGGDYGVAPLSASFEQNLVARPVGKTITPITGLVKPAYSGEIYHGGALGISPEPAGIDTQTDPRLVPKTINGYTLYFPTAENVRAGARVEELKPLRETDVGTSYKN